MSCYETRQVVSYKPYPNFRLTNTTDTITSVDFHKKLGYPPVTHAKESTSKYPVYCYHIVGRNGEQIEVFAKYRFKEGTILDNTKILESYYAREKVVIGEYQYFSYWKTFLMETVIGFTLSVITVGNHYK